MRRLIVNADDFGLTAGINRAVVEGHEHGLVTSATLMANGVAFAEAASMSKAHPRLSVGCHVGLVDGAPQLDASQVPSLINKKKAGDAAAEFPQRLGEVAMRATAGNLSAAEIEAEVTAQIRRLQSSGIIVSHLDTHKHTHIFPQVLQPILKAATACGVGAIRNPFETVRWTELARRPGLWKRWLQVRGLSSLAGRFRRAVEDAGIATPDGSLGIVVTGFWDEPGFTSLLRNMPEGTWEMVSHPGYEDNQLRGTRTRLLASRREELRILTSAASREFLDQQGIQLISYHDLIGISGQHSSQRRAGVS